MVMVVVVVSSGYHSLIQLLSCILAHLLEVLAAPAGTHGPRIILVEGLVALFELNARMLAGDDDGAAGFSRAYLGPLEGRGEIAVAGDVLVAVDGGCRRG